MESVTKRYLNNRVLQAACTAFGIDVEKVKLIRENSNLIYDAGDKMLRLTHSSIREQADIQNEIDWAVFLHQAQLPVVEYLKSTGGQLLEIVESSDTYFNVVCMRTINGKRGAPHELNDDFLLRLGALTGSLHKAALKYNQNEAVNKVLFWSQTPEVLSINNLPKEFNNLTTKGDALVQQIEQIPIKGDNYGVIHNDIHAGNYLIDEQGQIILFDFEMACRSWFINDIASVFYYSLHHFGRQELKEKAFLQRFIPLFWKGYNKYHSIDKSEYKYIIPFFEYRDLLIYAYLLRVWDTEHLTEGQIKYMKRLESSIDKGFGYLEEVFL